MKLTYFTNAVVPARSAHSIQIQVMSKAFHSLMGANFLLISPSNQSSDPNVPFQWRRLMVPKNRIVRYLTTIIFALLHTKEFGPIVFTRDTPLAFLMVLLRKRVIFEVHDQMHRLIPLLMLRLLKNSPKLKLVAISEALGKFYKNRYAISREKLLIAHDGVFPEDYCLPFHSKAYVRMELGLPLDKIVVVHTGSLYKGGGELFEYVARSSKADVIVVQVGGTDEESALWRAHYLNRGFDNVIFIPHQPLEKVRLYQISADLLFYINTRKSSIYWCTSPLKLFEYMATGVPILGSNLGSVAEIINESNAFCFDPDRPETIADSFSKFLTDPTEAKRRAAQARTETETLYSWRHRAERIITFANEGWI